MTWNHEMMPKLTPCAVPHRSKEHTGKSSRVAKRQALRPYRDSFFASRPETLSAMICTARARKKNSPENHRAAPDQDGKHHQAAGAQTIDTCRAPLVKMFKCFEEGDHYCQADHRFGNMVIKLRNKGIDDVARQQSSNACSNKTRSAAEKSHACCINHKNCEKGKNRRKPESQRMSRMDIPPNSSTRAEMR